MPCCNAPFTENSCSKGRLGDCFLRRQWKSQNLLPMGLCRDWTPFDNDWQMRTRASPLTISPATMRWSFDERQPHAVPKFSPNQNGSRFNRPIPTIIGDCEKRFGIRDLRQYGKHLCFGSALLVFGKKLSYRIRYLIYFHSFQYTARKHDARTLGNAGVEAKIRQPRRRSWSWETPAREDADFAP